MNGAAIERAFLIVALCVLVGVVVHLKSQPCHDPRVDTVVEEARDLIFAPVRTEVHDHDCAPPGYSCFVSDQGVTVATKDRKHICAILWRDGVNYCKPYIAEHDQKEIDRAIGGE